MPHLQVYRKLRVPLLLAVLFSFAASLTAQNASILNVSYDVAREFYEQFNPLFVKHRRENNGQTVRVSQSHAGSSKQARAVVDGLAAEVVTMNQPTDIDMIAEKGRNLVAKDWRKKFPHDSAPYRSTMIFLVRAGNPKQIRNWDDLARPGVSVVVPNPKTSGNGRYSYLAAWIFASEKFGGDEARIKQFLTTLFANVPILDTGGRGATTTFVQREVGDVLLTFESEALTTIRESGADKFEAVYPSVSVEAAMPVALNERVVDRRGTRELATDYLNFHYSEPAQELIAKSFYRPVLESVAAKYREQFKPLRMVKVEEAFGSWANAQKIHLNEGGTFDQIYAARKR